jgi:hypothetical protein
VHALDGFAECHLTGLTRPGLPCKVIIGLAHFFNTYFPTCCNLCVSFWQNKILKYLFGSFIGFAYQGKDIIVFRLDSL